MAQGLAVDAVRREVFPKHFGASVPSVLIVARIELAGVAACGSGFPMFTGLMGSTLKTPGSQTATAANPDAKGVSPLQAIYAFWLY